MKHTSHHTAPKFALMTDYCDVFMRQDGSYHGWIDSKTSRAIPKHIGAAVLREVRDTFGAHIQPMLCGVPRS